MFVILAKNQLRTYLSFTQAMVASVVLIFSHSCYQWHSTTNKRNLAATKNDEVLKLHLVKGLNVIVTSRINFWGLKKISFLEELSHTLEPKFQVRLDWFCSNRKWGLLKSHVFRRKNGTRAAFKEHTYHLYLHIYIYIIYIHIPRFSIVHP